MDFKKIKFYFTKIAETFSFLSNIKFARVKSNKNILIYGISRGGTTLLAETLVSILNARLVWEPLFNYKKVSLNALNPYSLESYKKLNLGWNPHVASSEDIEANTYFDDFFKLKKRNIRFLRFTNPDTFADSKFTIHKFCFGNFMYSYFQKRYHFKSIILLRHPFAVAASMLKFGNNYDYHKQNYSVWKYGDSDKSGTFFKEFEDKYDLIVSAFTLLVFQTVSQFSFALDNFDKDNSIIVFYEDLVVQKKSAHSALEKFLEMSINYTQFEVLLNKESFSSSSGHTADDAMAQLSKWTKSCTGSDIRDGLNIFEAFNFSLYTEAILPNRENLSTLLNA